MPDLKISELPAATSVADADITPFVQGSTTRRASISQLRGAVLADRGVDVRDFGAVGNGSANDAPAIQAAINALGTAGGVVQLGPRTYRLASAIVITNTSVRLQGAGFNEGGGPGNGTWLTVDQTGFTPITFTGVAARGSVVRDIAFRQSHTAPLNASWAPTNYDYLIRVTDCLGGVDFDNVMLSGINRGIFVRNSGRTDFRRIRGQVFTAGIEIDEAFDTGRIQNLHFWPFWSGNNFVVRWQQANCDALIFRRCDGIFVDQAFALGARSMFRFSSSAAGFTQKFSIGQAYADFVRYGIWVEANGTDGQIDAMTVQCEIYNAAGAPLPGSIGIYVNAASSRIQIGSLRIDDAEDNPIRIEQHTNLLNIGALRCVNFNLRNNGAAAIHLANAVGNTPNRVNLGAAPLLETPILGPLFNAGSNGSVGLLAPAGEAVRPGLSVGQSDTGLYRPAAAILAATAGGAEVLRAASGSLTLGAAPGAHGLEVTTPASAVNRPEVLGGVTGTPGLTGWRAVGLDANISTVIGQPKGAGALMAQFPDNAVSGGNARGVGAVDWQTARTAANQVASGSNATIGGGQGNLANSVNATVAGGSGNIANGAGGAVAGGISNTASGANSLAGGNNSTASGLSSIAIGGGVVASGIGSVALGSGSTASGQNSIALGRFASTRGVFGRIAFAPERAVLTGDAQCGEHPLNIQTTAATPTRITANTGAASPINTINLPDFGAYAGVLTVVAKAQGSTASATWRVNVSAVRGNGVATTALYEGGGSAIVPTASSGLGSAWRLDVAADTTNGGIAVTGTGAAASIVTWSVRYSNVEAVSAS